MISDSDGDDQHTPLCVGGVEEWAQTQLELLCTRGAKRDPRETTSRPTVGNSRKMFRLWLEMEGMIGMKCILIFTMSNLVSYLPLSLRLRSLLQVSLSAQGSIPQPTQPAPAASAFTRPSLRTGIPGYSCLNCSKKAQVSLAEKVASAPRSLGCGVWSPSKATKVTG